MLGPLGLIAGAMTGKTSNIHMITITYTDGEKSLVEVDKVVFDRLMSINWRIENNQS